jgi:hypothetical protein
MLLTSAKVAGNLSAPVAGNYSAVDKQSVSGAREAYTSLTDATKSQMVNRR